jgi:tetrahydromethanopterin S-methyltransferase subunit G
MSLPVQITFALAPHIARGLAQGVYVLCGGIIRDTVKNNNIIGFLRGTTPTPVSSPNNVLNLIISGASLLTSGANIAVSAKGFNNVNHRLDKGFSDVNQQLSNIENQIQAIGKPLQINPGILQISTAASVLNLGVSVMGFAVISQRLNEIENQLKQAGELLNKINRKIDLSFHANFHAGIELALNAFTMTKIENRRSSALQAINRFLEAEHIYKDYTVNELSQKSPIIDKYILTLSLAYIAEARCHLELEEHETALRRFQEGAKFIRLLLQKYIELMLTSNPAAYLHPQFKGQIDLHKLTQIYQWIDPNFNENTVFEIQRENMFKLTQSHDEWLSSLPSAIVDRSEIQWGIFGGNPTPFTGRFKKEAYKRLPQVFEVMESMIETNRRFEAYQTEVQAISQLGISFHDWLKLTPSTEIKPDGAELMYIIPSKPLELQPSI